jgi:hypothetical protein
VSFKFQNCRKKGVGMFINQRALSSPLIVVVALIVSLACVASAQAEKKSVKGEREPGQEQRLAQKDLPAVVLMAFQKLYPAASIKEVGKEVEDSTTYYEIESVDGKSRRTVLYSSDGKLTEIEEIISAKQLPDSVRTVIARNYPKGDLEKAEKITKNEVTTYEVKIENGKENIEAIFDSAGRLINSEKLTDKEDSD